MIRVVVDSTADVPQQVRQELGISVVPVSFAFGRDVFLDDVDMTRDEFYARLIEGDVMPTTSQPSIGQFEEVYRPIIAAGDQIVSIHIGSKLSGTFRAAQQAAELVAPDRIRVVDSDQVAMPIGYLGEAAARWAREGRTIDEVVALVEAMRPRTFLYAGLDTLKYLEKGGRINTLRAFIGTLLNVKPVLTFREGLAHPAGQVRTFKRMPAKLLELAQGHVPLERLDVLYTTDRAPALELADLLAANGLMARERMRLIQVGGALGTHAGPGAIGISGVSRA